MTDQTMRAMVLRSWGAKLESTRVPRPSPGPGQVLIEMKACSVGLTVVNSIDGVLSPQQELLPRIPGHEIVGVVAQAGAGVTRVQPGDRVCNYAYLSCGSCKRCARGKEPLCINYKGMPGVHAEGGYAEYVVLPEFNVVPLPDEISFLEASAIPDAITTSYHVISSRGNVRPGDRVTIIGAAGGVGVHLVQMARLFGGEVIAVDIDDAKLTRTREYGATTTINFGSPGRDELFRTATDGEGSDVIVDMVGRPETISWAQESLAAGGRAVFLTVFPGAAAPVEPRNLVRLECSLVGSRYAAKWELLAAIELVRTGKIKPVVSETTSLENVDALHDRLRSSTFFGRGAIIF